MKKFLLSMLTVLLMLPLAVQAQFTATFGTGTTATSTGGSAGAPMSSGTLFSYVQSIYTASELSAAGVPAGAVITSIAFSNGTNTNTVMHACRTYMGHRASPSFASTSDLTPASALTLVDSSDWVTTGTGWFDINLQTPFVWNGVDNIVIGVTFGGAAAGNINCGYYYTVMSDNKQLRRYASHSSAGAASVADPTYTAATTPDGASITQSVSPNRPNLKISYLVSGCPSFTPSVAHIGTYTADLYWLNYNQSAYGWDLMYGETGTFDTLSGGTTISNLTDTAYTLSGLNASTSYTVYLKSYCSSETGSWSAPRQFTTEVTCPHPHNFTVQGVSGNTVDLSWTPGDIESAWDVYITSSTVLPDASTTPTTTVTDLFYTDYNMNPSTEYYAYVRANCGGGDVSTWESVSFATTCMPITTLPLMEDFDDETGATSTSTSTNNLPLCWNHLCGSYSSYAGYPIIYNSSTYASSGSNAVRFYTYTGTTDYGNQYAIMPAIDINTYPMNTLQVNFDMRKNSTSYASFMLVVGVMGNPTDASSFVPVDTVVNATQTYENYTVYFNDYMGQGSCIAFMAPRIAQSGVTYNTGFLDNVVVETIPSCLKPSDVTLNNITATSVDVDWVPAGPEYAWEVAVAAHGDDVANAYVENAYTHPYTVYNLNDNTQYDVYVRADCGGGDYSSWTFYKTFTTTPFCSSPRNLTISQIVGTSALVSWNEALYGSPADYTVEYTEAGQNNWSLQIVAGTSCFLTGLTPHTNYEVRVSSNCTQGTADYVTDAFTTGCLSGGDIVIGNGTTTNSYLPVYTLYKNAYSQQIFLASEMNGPTTINSVSFEMGTVNQQRNYKIYLMHTNLSTSTSWIPANNAQLCFQGTHNYVTGWNTFNFDTPFQYNGTDNLVLIVVDINSSYTSGNTNYVHAVPSGTTHLWYSDTENYTTTSTPGGTSYSTTTYRNNVKFGGECDSLATCVAPNINISDVTAESITIDWAPGAYEASWNLEYSTDNTNWTSEGVVTTAPYTITGLTSDTQYYVRMQSDCGNGETSGWTGTSARTVCSSINIPYFENFDDAPASGSGNMVTCWTRNTNYTTTAYPYTSSSYHHSGNYSVYFYGTSAYYSYIASPRFDDQVQMNDLQVSFYAYKESAAYNIEMGIMTDPTDYNSFVRIGNPISPSAISSWELFEVNTSSYTGSGHYLAFRIPAVATSYMYIDDISVDNIPLCEHVTNIQMNGATLTSTSADISWSAGGMESEWEVVCGPAGTITNPETETSEYVYGTPSITLTGLTGDTQYDVYIRANCSASETSTWMTYSFRTACAEIASLPYINSFDTYGTGTTVYPSCWGKINTYTSADRPYINTTNYSAPGSLYFYTATSGTYNIAIMPAIDASIPVNTLRAKFMYRASSSTDRLVVGVMTNPTDANTFVEVSTITPASTATAWIEKIVDFTNYTGTGRYIAFKNAYTSTSSYAYMDNLTVDYQPACLAPTNLTVSNLTTTSADIAWDAEPGESTWEILVVPANIPNPDFSNADITYTNNYTLTSLNEASSYTVYVRTVCANGGGNSDWAMIDIATPQTPAQTPYFCDFEDGIENASWSLANGSSTNKWYIGKPSGFADSVLFVSNTGTSTDYSITSPCVIWAYRDIQFDANSAEFELSFNWKAMGESTIDYMHAYIGDIIPVEGSTSSTLTVPTGLIQLDETRLNQQSTWQHFSTVIDGSYAGQTKRLYFVWRDDSSVGTAPAAVVDSIQIVGKSCGTPYNIHVENLTSTSADVVFSSSPSISAWEYVFTTSATANPDNEYPTTTYTNSINFSSLTQNTTYYVYVRSDCGGEYSFWSDAYSFTTPCEALTVLPYSQNFDGVSGATSTSVSTSNLPACWSNNNNGTSTSYSGYPIVYNSSTFAYSGTNALRFYVSSASGTYDDQIAVLPPVDAAMFPVNTLQLTLQTRKISASYTGILVVGVMSNPSDKNTFVPVDTVEASSTTYEEFTVYFTNYSGNGNFVAIMGPQPTTSYNEAYVDDIVLEPIPACPKPTNVVSTATTENTVSLSWTEVGNASSWVVEYGPANFSIGQGMTETVYGTPSTTITGLSASTMYDFYVKSDCGNGDYSSYSNVYSAATQCGAITVLPFSENFDNVAGAATTSVSTNNLPTCWSNYNVGTSTSYSGYPIVYNSSTYAHSGSNAMRFYCYSTSGTYADQIAILPPIDVNQYPLNTLQLTFQTRKISTSYSGTLVIGVMTSATDRNSFVPVDTIEPAGTTYEEATVYFTNYPGTGNLIAIMGPQPSTSYNQAYVDDIVVDLIPSCPRPTGVTATASTQNSITLSWTEIGSATSWVVEYGPANFTLGQGTTVNVNNTPSTTIIGLSASTPYDFYVKSECGGGDFSNYTSVYSAATSCGAIDAMPYSENFDSYGTGESAFPGCWSKLNTYSANRPYCHATYYNSAPAGLYFYSSSTTYNIAITPEIDASIPVNTLQATFNYRAFSTSSSYNNRIVVGVMTSVLDASTFVPVDTIDATATTWASATVSFANYTGNGQFIAFKNGPSTSGTCYFMMDDLVLDYDTSGVGPGPGVTCNTPTNLAVSNITTTGATATWTAGGSESAWNLQYKAASAASWSSTIPVTTTSYTFAGLTPNTAYQVRVQAACDATTTSNWTSAVSFTTAEQSQDPCAAPSNLTAYDIHGDQLTLTWQENGTATSWTIYYRIHGASSWMTQTVNTTTYVLTGLEAQTQYDIQVVANCSNNETSEPSNTVNPTTTVGVNDYVGANVTVAPNPTTGVVRVSSSNFQVSGVEVYDVYGKLLNSMSADDSMVEVDLGQYAAGVYFLRVFTENGVVTKRVVKR